jgi:hypothetical protein
MDKKKEQYEAELLALPALRFILSGAPTQEMKEVLRLTPVHRPGEEMKISIRKLITHLTDIK